MYEVASQAKPQVLTAADPVSVLEHQLEKRGSFSPLEAPSYSTANVETPLPTDGSIKSSGTRSRAQVRPDTPDRANGRSDALIEVAPKFKVKKGQKITDNLYLGDPIGKGLQGGVYALTDANGNQNDTYVLKVCHRYALLTKVKREWEVGRRVNSTFEPEHSLPGFMGTAHGLVTAKGVFRGMLLERLNGAPVTKKLKHPAFHDVQFVKDMLHSVFTTLELAQGAIGFHHADFRLANVMELEEGSEQAKSHVGAEAANQGDATAEMINRFRIIDFGLADFSEYYAAGFVEMAGPSSAGQLLRPLASVPLALEHLKAIPKVSLLERMYRYAWRHKGDVFNITWDLTRVLDGRVWPKDDERQVRLMLAFIHHVTGVRLRAYFAPRGNVDKDGGLRLDHMVCCPPIRMHTGALHVLRIRAVRLRAWFNPKNPGITASEALAAPFFKYEGRNNSTDRS